MTNYILGAPALPPIANPDWRDTLHTIQRRVRVVEYLTVPPSARAWSPAGTSLGDPRPPHPGRGGRLGRPTAGQHAATHPREGRPHPVRPDILPGRLADSDRNIRLPVRGSRPA